MELLRCQQTEEICPGTSDLKVVKEHKGGFGDISEEIELVGFVSCGGCPGKHVIWRAKEMVNRGADAIAFSTCMSRGNPISFPCPHYEQIKKSVAEMVGDGVKMIEYTH